MLSKEYALAFYQFGNDLGKVEEFEIGLKSLVGEIDKEPEFMKIITHPKLSVKEKKEIVSNITSSLDSDITNFCYVLIDNGRFNVISEIYEQFVFLMKEANDVMVVKAYSAKELSKQNITDLTKKLEKEYSKKIEIVAIVDENVLGGVRLEFNGKVLDGTLKANLDDLKSRLI